MPDETQQESTLPRLRPAQARVIAGIAQGRTIAAATRDAGVDRTTFYLWKKTDPLFAALFCQAQDVYVEELNAQVRDLAQHAVAAIQRILTDETTPVAIQFKAAKEVLGATRALSPPRRSGNPDPEECEINIESEHVRRATARNGIEEHRQYANYMSKKLNNPKRLPPG